MKKDLKLPKYSEVFRKPVSSIPVESTIVQNPHNISPISVTPPHIIPKESENIKKQTNIRQTVQRPIKRKIDKSLRLNAPPKKQKVNRGEKRGVNSRWDEIIKKKVKKYHLTPSEAVYDVWRL